MYGRLLIRGLGISPTSQYSFPVYSLLLLSGQTNTFNEYNRQRWWDNTSTSRWQKTVTSFLLASSLSLSCTLVLWSGQSGKEQRTGSGQWLVRNWDPSATVLEELKATMRTWQWVLPLSRLWEDCSPGQNLYCVLVGHNIVSGGTPWDRETRKAAQRFTRHRKYKITNIILLNH